MRKIFKIDANSNPAIPSNARPLGVIMEKVSTNTGGYIERVFAYYDLEESQDEQNIREPSDRDRGPRPGSKNKVKGF